eukprot:196533-Pyramimonas_sp.AAC.1
MLTQRMMCGWSRVCVEIELLVDASHLLGSGDAALVAHLDHDVLVLPVNRQHNVRMLCVLPNQPELPDTVPRFQ